MRLAFVSSIPCTPTFGGPLQIHRHFAERQDFEFFDFSDNKTPEWEQWLGANWGNSRSFKRISNTRLHPYLLAAAFGTRLNRSAKELLPKVLAVRPQAIVTVAYGRQAFVAQRIAEKMRLPLITFFHDWWPDLLYSLTPLTRRWLDNKMRSLARASALVLSVGPELIAELEPHPNAVVLPPIPAALPNELNQPKIEAPLLPKPPLLVYAGTLGGDYGAMIRELGNVYLANPRPQWRLRAYGRADDWNENDRRRLSEAGVYGGYLNQGSPMQAALAQADALLVVMDFEPKNRRRVRTSFPSKILDYAPFGKPLVVWGPEECAAAGFMRSRNVGLLVNSPEPRIFISELEEMFADAGRRARLGETFRQLSQSIFNPKIIHAEMKREIEEVLNSRASAPKK